MKTPTSWSPARRLGKVDHHRRNSAPPCDMRTVDCKPNRSRSGRSATKAQLQAYFATKQACRRNRRQFQCRQGEKAEAGEQGKGEKGNGKREKGSFFLRVALPVSTFSLFPCSPFRAGP